LLKSIGGMSEEPQIHSRSSRFEGLAAYHGVVVLLLGIGASICVYLILNKPIPRGEREQTAGRLVQVFEAQKGSHRVAINAYGTARASEVWAAIAEVKGRAIEVDPRFEAGEVLPAGTVLVRIDRADYLLAVSAFKAEADAKRVQVKELEQTKKNLDEIVKLQRQQTQLAAAERDRLSKAFEGQAVSRSGKEVAEIAYQVSLTKLQETLNALALLPVQSELATAQLEAATAHLKEAEQDLAKCEIRLPMAARCVSKSIELDQYVAAGQQLGAFLSLQTAEVVAMVETRKMPLLFPREMKDMGTIDLTQMNLDKSLWERFRVPVKVSWGLGDLRPEWWGRLARIDSALDPGTRTVPVIIAVEGPYAEIQPGVRPPLLPGAFCDVTIYGMTVDNVVVVPQDALRDQRVYLLRDGKLHIQPVTVLAREEDLAVVSEGIEAGDLVVLTDLFPASEGMPLRGKLVDNPAKLRSHIEIPPGLFKQREETTP
jgi:multidrug efflux system membrane fusion protein